MINSNDLFSQIGFLADPSSSKSSARSISSRYHEQSSSSYNSPNKNKKAQIIQQQFQQPKYTTSLEIQLSQNEHHILNIKSYDDPRELAQRFCQQHSLNKLAIEIVEKKIIQAKSNQQRKLIDQNMLDMKEKSKQSARTVHKPGQIAFSNNCNQDFLKNTPYKNKSPFNRTQSNISRQMSITSAKTNNKNTNASKVKKTQKSSNKSPLKHRHSKSTLDQACQNLYFRGMLQVKAQEQKRIKRQQQKQKQQQSQLTFKPKINLVSQKIIQFRRQTATVKPKNQNKIKKQLTQKFYQQMKQCTFTPQINKISKIIVNNREAYRTQNQHFNHLFHNTDGQPNQFGYQLSERRQFPSNRKSKKFLLKQKQKEEQKLFRPQLNPRSKEIVKEPFYQRLQRAVQSRQRIKDNENLSQEYSFHPKVGRGPYNDRPGENKQNMPIWQQLYQQSRQRQQKKKKDDKKMKNDDQEQMNQTNSSKSSFSFMSKTSTNLYYENLIQKRIAMVFELLDQDTDGLISPDTISIENCTKNVLIFLKPIFQEMDQLNAELNYNEFKRAVINLLNDSDPYKKGLFLTDGTRKLDTECTFNPQINTKSKQLASFRLPNQNIHTQLYEQGLKHLHRKQQLLFQQRAKRQQLQLSQCSFKPSLKASIKAFQPHQLSKKLSQMQLDLNLITHANHYDSKNYYGSMQQNQDASFSNIS